MGLEGMQMAGVFVFRGRGGDRAKSCPTCFVSLSRLGWWGIAVVIILHLDIWEGAGRELGRLGGEAWVGP